MLYASGSSISLNGAANRPSASSSSSQNTIRVMVRFRPVPQPTLEGESSWDQQFLTAHGSIAAQLSLRVAQASPTGLASPLDSLTSFPSASPSASPLKPGWNHRAARPGEHIGTRLGERPPEDLHSQHQSGTSTPKGGTPSHSGTVTPGRKGRPQRSSRDGSNGLIIPMPHAQKQSSVLVDALPSAFHAPPHHHHRNSEGDSDSSAGPYCTPVSSLRSVNELELHFDPDGRTVSISSHLLPPQAPSLAPASSTPPTHSKQKSSIGGNAGSTSSSSMMSLPPVPLSAASNVNSSFSTSIQTRTYTFDRVFPPTASQEDLFQAIGAEAVDDVLAGRNATILAYGPTGSGKCFGLGTRVMMADGEARRVEELTVGDELMADDGTPCRVIEAYRGHTATDAAAHRELPTFATTPCTYRIEPTGSTGKSAWTCNAEHLLVLQMERETRVQRRAAGQWVVAEWQLTESDGIEEQRPVERILASFDQECAARSFLAAHFLSSSPSAPSAAAATLQWEASAFRVHSYPAELLSLIRLATPIHAVQFPDKRERSFVARMRDAAGGLELSRETIHCAAWTIGVWAARPLSPTVDSSLADRLQSCFAAQAIPLEASTVVRRLLRAYDLTMDQERHLPRTLTTEDVIIRQHILAGLIDSSSASKRSHCQITLATQQLVDDVSLLCAGLGLRTNFVPQDDDDASTPSYHLRISGASLASLPLQMPLAVDDSAETACPDVVESFTIKSVSHSAYIGFTLSSSSGRFLLADGTIGHNSYSMFGRTLMEPGIIPRAAEALFAGLPTAQQAAAEADVLSPLSPQEAFTVTVSMVELYNECLKVSGTGATPCARGDRLLSGISSPIV